MSPRGSGTFAALSGRPDLRVLVVVMGVGTFGTGVASIAFTYVAYTISGSLTSSVLVTLVCTLPAVLLIPVTSRIVNRFDVRPYLIIVLIFSAITHVTYVVLITKGWLSLAFLFIASAITGTVTALTTPGWTMLGRRAVPDAKLDGFNALTSSSMAIGAVVGLLVGGVLYRDHGAAALFVVNAVTGLTLAVGAARTRVGGGTATAGVDAATPAHVPWPTVARRLAGIPVIRTVLVTEVILLLLAWPISKLLPQVAHDVSDSSVTYSWLLAAFSGGPALIGFIMQRQRARFTHKTLVLQSLVLVVACMAAIAASELVSSPVVHMVVLVILLLAMGLMLGQLSVIHQSAIEIATPTEMRGQMFAFVPGASDLIQVLAALGIAAIVDHANVWVVILGMALLLGSLVGLLQSRHWWDVLSALDATDGGRTGPSRHVWQSWSLVLPAFPHLPLRSGRR